MSGQIEQLLDALESDVAALGSVVVAFSGGVDSSLVACIAVRSLGDRALAVTATSGALASGELSGARDVAAAVGIAHETVSTDELRREGYRRNGRDRCYHCKTELYETLSDLAAERGYATLLSGANADDRGDWRPGLVAAEEHGVRHPLLERGVTKSQVRELAGRLGVPSARKVASPCLASRIPYGTPVTNERMRRIDAAERAVRALGYAELRVRDHGDLGKVEIATADLERALSPGGRAAIAAAVRGAGFAQVAIDLDGFRSGALNESFSARTLTLPLAG
jgi:pyridinium-3,5-biscarboxylic acid mononucleotide sulfurtransferase